MKRRDFIKGFATVSAAVPIASALASTKGVESIIETFQMSDIEPEVISHISYVPETIFQDKPNSIIKRINTQNEMIEHRDKLCPVLVLAPTYVSFRYWARETKAKNAKLYGNYLDRFEFVHIYKREQLLGAMRNLRIIGIRDYWLSDYHNEIMEMIQVRSIEIYTPNKLVNVINYNNKLWD